MIKVQHISWYGRIADYLMWPIMWVLIGFGRDRPQETHQWHMQGIAWDSVPGSAAVTVEGDDPARLRREKSIVFGAIMHFTVFGGLTRYAVLEADTADHWHIGWRHTWARKPLCKVHKLPVAAKRIRMLTGYQGTKTEFFAMDDSGSFLPFRVVGKGTIGDKKFPNVRLF